ncbi:MAG: metallophosphoesterase family protein [Gaiellaceae bacterium]
MQIAVISDTHMPRGARALPDACVERLRDADLILHAGDLTGAAFLDELLSFGPAVAAVHGNMDEAAVRERLPEDRVVDAAGARIAMVHIPGPSGGRAQRLAARFRGCDAVVYGHTHVADVTRHGAMWILNPGSPTERRRSPARSMLWLTIPGGGPEHVLLEPVLLTFDP